MSLTIKNIQQSYYAVVCILTLKFVIKFINYDDLLLIEKF